MSDTAETLGNLPEEVNKIKKYPWAYIFLIVCNLFTFLATNYFKEKENKPCSDMNIYLLKKIDSSSRDQILYMRHSADVDLENKRLKVERDSAVIIIHSQVNPLSNKIMHGKVAK